MSRRKKDGGGHKGGNHERWLITYADLITLLMVFFIVMYAISTVNQKKYESLAASLKSAFNTGSGQNTIAEFQGEGILSNIKYQVNNEGIKSPEDNELKKVMMKIKEYVDENGLQKSIHLTLTERGLVISLVDTVLFQSGQADLTPQAKLVLNKIVGMMATVTNQIRVEGHTDNIPISNVRFPSNWELSTARATKVISFLIDKGLSPEKLSAAGYSEYRPVVPNTSEQNKALNRRVDIVILRSSLNKQEPPVLGDNPTVEEQEKVQNQ